MFYFSVLECLNFLENLTFQEEFFMFSIILFHFSPLFSWTHQSQLEVLFTNSNIWTTCQSVIFCYYFPSWVFIIHVCLLASPIIFDAMPNIVYNIDSKCCYILPKRFYTFLCKADRGQMRSPNSIMDGGDYSFSRD